MTFLSAKELYAMFLDSDWWIALSRYKRTLQPWCEKCDSSTDLQSHHISYPENWFDTTTDILKVFCRSCHIKEHALLASFTTQVVKCSSTPKRRFRIKTKNFKRPISKQKLKRLRKKWKQNSRRYGRSVPTGLVSSKRGLNFKSRRNWVSRGTSSN